MSKHLTNSQFRKNDSHKFKVGRFIAMSKGLGCRILKTGFVHFGSHSSAWMSIMLDLFSDSFKGKDSNYLFNTRINSGIIMIIAIIYNCSYSAIFWKFPFSLPEPENSTEKGFPLRKATIFGFQIYQHSRFSSSPAKLC